MALVKCAMAHFGPLKACAGTVTKLLFRALYEYGLEPRVEELNYVFAVKCSLSERLCRMEPAGYIHDEIYLSQ